jgi:hypothetical protein
LTSHDICVTWKITCKDPPAAGDYVIVKCAKNMYFYGGGDMGDGG